MTFNALTDLICCLKKDLASLTRTVTAIEETVIGGSVRNLTEWTTGENFRLPTITRDSDNVITTATVQWPDGETGTFTTVTKNATFLTIDSFTITYGATTITQPLITRNGDGGATEIPDLVFS